MTSFWSKKKTVTLSETLGLQTKVYREKRALLVKSHITTFHGTIIADLTKFSTEHEELENKILLEDLVKTLKPDPKFTTEEKTFVLSELSKLLMNEKLVCTVETDGILIKWSIPVEVKEEEKKPEVKEEKKETDKKA